MAMRFFLMLCMLVCSSHAFCTTYYMSQTGDDANDGLSAATPWKTLSHLSSIALTAGDSVLFKSGEVFTGTYFIQASSNATQPVFIGTYGGVVTAIISGSEPVVNWVSQPGGVYTADATAPVKGLWLNERLEVSARYPNSGWLRIDSSLGISGFVSNDLVEPADYWNGASVHVRSHPMFYEVRDVQTYDNGTILFNWNTWENQKVGYGFFLDHSLAALDTSNEWFFDPSVSEISYLPAAGVDPNSEAIEASVFENGFIGNGITGIVIDNLTFQRQFGNGIKLTSSDDVTIRNCVFSQILFRALSFEDTTNRVNIHDNDFSNLGGMGISFSVLFDGRIVDNDFHRVGMNPGYEVNGNAYGVAIGSDNLHQTFIGRNNIDSIGGPAFHLAGVADTLMRNIVKDAMLAVDEQGALFVFDNNTSDLVVTENIFYNTRGNCASCDHDNTAAMGIQIWFGTTGISLLRNTVAYITGDGIYLGNGVHNLTMTQNVVYDAETTQLHCKDDGNNELSHTGNVFTSNVLYALSPFQRCYTIQTSADSVPFALSDSNYFVNPYNYATISYESGLESSQLTLPEWQHKYHLDSASTSTYKFLLRYFTQDTVGAELITNGHFTNNYNNWSTQPEDVLELLLDNSNAMDDGCSKVRFTSLDSGYAQLNSATFQTTPGQLYQLGYSIYGQHRSAFYGEVFEAGGSFYEVGYRAARKSFANRLNVVDHFIPRASLFDQLFKFTFTTLDSVYWIDNVSILPVSGVKLDSTFYSRLLINTTPDPVTYDFGDSIFFNLDSVSISEITLQPYQSAVVIYIDGMVTGISHQVVSSQLNLWPNPASSFVNVSIPCDAGKATFEMYDVRGALVEKGSWQNCVEQIDVRQQTPGLYLLKVTQNGILYTAKFVVTR